MYHYWDRRFTLSPFIAHRKQNKIASYEKRKKKRICGKGVERSICFADWIHPCQYWVVLFYRIERGYVNVWQNEILLAACMAGIRDDFISRKEWVTVRKQFTQFKSKQVPMKRWRGRWCKTLLLKKKPLSGALTMYFQRESRVIYFYKAWCQISFLFRNNNIYWLISFADDFLSFFIFCCVRRELSTYFISRQCLTLIFNNNCSANVVCKETSAWLLHVGACTFGVL